MTTSLTLLKPQMSTAITAALYDDIVSNRNTYYYFLGKTLEWTPLLDEVLVPENHRVYETETRDRIIFMKKVTPADVAFMIPRYDWVQGQVYDMYDDQLGRQYEIDVSGAPNSFVLSGTFDVSSIGTGWVVTGDNIPTGARITSITPSVMTLSVPTTGIVDRVTVVNVAASGASSLETSRFYVLTNENAVYKCLFNNYGAESTQKPFSTTHEPIRTDDGYIWKYMYTIPGALTSKFRTLTEIPVTTAVKGAYYSKGSIRSVTINSFGTGYQPGDSIVVSGNGHLVDSVYRITGVGIDEPGIGYATPPAITVDDPFDSLPFVANTSYLIGSYIKHLGRIYEVQQGGVVGSEPPTHTSSVAVPNGTAALKFVGLSPIATAELDEDGRIDAITLEGVIGNVVITNVGSGYDPESPPNVTITGDGVGAVAVAHVTQSGYLAAITLAERGSGYTTSSITIDPPPGEGVQAEAQAEVYYGFGYRTVPAATAAAPVSHDYVWEPLLEVAAGDVIKSGDNFYVVVGTGDLGTVPPTHIAGTDTNGEVQLTHIAQQARLTSVYSKTRAQLYPIIEDGQLTNVVINDPGVNYTVASVELLSATGEGANITVDLSIGDLNTRQANTELLAVPGSIEVIYMLSQGSLYSWATVEVIGDGQGCTAEAVIQGGKIVAINVTNAGFGYTRASVVITGNEGSVQAYARPIVSPLDGHGRNAVEELFAKNLTVSTTIQLDRNQGFIVDNDYRQIGLIKNPRAYGSIAKYNAFAGSTCFVVTGNFVFSDIEVDAEIVDTEGNKYVVIAKNQSAPEGDAPTSILIQSLSSFAPSVGTTFIYGDSSQAIASEVVLPNVNKYSGDMMFIDNRNSFQPTSEQSLALKTVIRL